MDRVHRKLDGLSRRFDEFFILFSQKYHVSIPTESFAEEYLDSIIRNGSEENAQNDYLGSLDHEMIDSNNQSSRLKEVSREFLEIEKKKEMNSVVVANKSKE